LNVLITTYGSSGDVHPMLGLALALRARGHRVTLVTSGYFQALVERAGIEFVALGTREEFLLAVRDPDLWNPRRGFQCVWRAVEQVFRDEYRIVAERYVPGETVALTSCLGFGTRIAHEKLGVPLVNVHLQPAVLWSQYDSPQLGPMLAGPRVPRWLKRLQFWMAETFFVDRTVAPSANAFRRELGLPPVQRTMRWWHTGTHSVCLFPEWYAPRQPDWPTELTLTEFPLWDERGVTDVPAEAAEFVERFGPPIVFTPGSGMAQGERFFDEAVAACRILKRPGMLLTRFAEQIPGKLPGDVRHFDYVPFSELLPQAAAIVHHGGIGTTAQALRAGIPQLIMPMSHDQPDNAARVRRLGAGAWLQPSSFRGARVARTLQELLQSDEARRSCAAAAARFTGVEPFAKACDVIEGAAPGARYQSAAG
jgi:UDP:flavonoid glycosyltransferase YjiC (YdhE family)